MTDYGRVKSTIKPNAMVIDEFSVWIHSNITEIPNEDYTEYEYNMVQYTKDEFIMMQAEKNLVLEAEITNTQLALCEIYELMG
jgi:hypothetical protein